MISTSTRERFGGIARLYGDLALARFASSHVCLIGIGGVGTWAAESLARSGVGKITLIDLDDICITNVNRQLHAMDGTIGKQKTLAMAERIRAINPECEVTCQPHFFSEKNADQLLSAGFDYVVDAIDHIRAKVHLIHRCREMHIPVVVCGSAGGLTDPTKIQVADMAKVHNDAMIKLVRTELRSKHGFPKGSNGKLKKFGIEVVFSSESPVFPTCEGEVTSDRKQLQGTKLNCVSGYGSITHITASVGLFAAERCLRHLAATTSDAMARLSQPR